MVLLIVQKALGHDGTAKRLKGYISLFSSGFRRRVTKLKGPATRLTSGMPKKPSLKSRWRLSNRP